SMVEVTHGEYDVRDVVKNLYEDYALKGVGYRVEDILSTFNAISGNDYTEFFNAYVYGDERLPILEESDDYLFDWATLGDKAYRSMPNAEKVRPWTQATVPASETATLLEMRKESRHFTVYFHQQDAKMAALLLLDCEKAYDAVAKLYGDEAKLKIRMFMTYNGTEYAVLGGRPEMIYDEKASAGGVAVEAGDEISWLRPIFNRNTTQMCDVKGPIHELGHAMLRQIYPGVYKNWEQWFNEGMPLSMMAWLDKRWAPASESCSPFIDHEPLQQLQRSLLGVSSSIVPLTQLAKMNYAQFNDTGRLLFQGEGIAFHFYINSRYDDGLQRLLTKYDEGVPLSVAAERAFGVTYADIENDLWATAGKAALNLDYTEFALSKMRREGVDTSLAQKLLPEEPFLALLVAYAAEARAGAGFERLVFGTITPDAPVKMDLGTTPLTSLNVSSAQRLDNFVVTVEEAMPAEVSTAAQGEVYCYVRVNSSSEGAGPITIVFKVESSWFSEHEANVSSTSMVRHTANGWTPLPTEQISQDDAYTYFSAVSPGMSVFAITAARNVSKVVPSTTINGWVSPAAFGTPTTLFLVVDGLHPTVQNSGNDEPFIVVKLVDSKGSILVEKGYNGKGLTGYGDYNPDKSLAPGSYRMEFWNGNVLVKIIPIIFSTDIVSPTISSFTPTNGSVITSKTVSITASFSDDKGIKTSSVTLRVDGNDVTSSATITATTISYEGALGNGPHTAQLTVSDAASNTASSTVSFTVSLQQQPQSPSNATTPATGSRSRAADLWPFLSVVFVALTLVLLVKGRKGGRLTIRTGAVMVGAAPLLFVISGLFLANTVINPAESLLYQVGLVLCFAVAPTLFASGIFALATVPHVKKEEYVAMQQIP
ncbi:MAG: PGF-pre-PGF domain-containing protein, partial [Candidatus Bathyarchaeota archaeon]|nr:PGF-pre-PGF domain-containing protein [Candidatus Bathyarchaeota archaeon]